MIEAGLERVLRRAARYEPIPIHTVSVNGDRGANDQSPMRILHDIIMVLFSVIVRYCCSIGTIFRFSVYGKSNLPDGPMVICANHASHLDYIALVEAMGIPYSQTIAIAATDFHFDHSLRAYVLGKMFNLAPLERAGSNPSPLARASSLLSCARDCRTFLDNGGRVVILYPEGSRTPDGQIKKFRSSVYPILKIIGYPVVPTFVDGTFRVFAKNRLVPRLGPLTVRFGAPMQLDPVARNAGANIPSEPQEGAGFVTSIEDAVRTLARAD